MGTGNLVAQAGVVLIAPRITYGSFSESRQHGPCITRDEPFHGSFYAVVDAPCLVARFFLSGKALISQDVRAVAQTWRTFALAVANTDGREE